MQLAKQLRGTLGQGAADDPGAGLTRKLLDVLHPPAPPPQAAAGGAEAAGGGAGVAPSQQPAAGPAEDEDGDVGVQPAEVDAAVDALDMHDMLATCPNEEIRKRLHGSIVGLREELKIPRRA